MEHGQVTQCLPGAGDRYLGPSLVAVPVQFRRAMARQIACGWCGGKQRSSKRSSLPHALEDRALSHHSINVGRALPKDLGSSKEGRDPSTWVVVAGRHLPDMRCGTIYVRTARSKQNRSSHGRLLFVLQRGGAVGGSSTKYFQDIFCPMTCGVPLAYAHGIH
jgi:hypothetical protein